MWNFFVEKKKKIYSRQTPKKFTVSELFTEESGWRLYFLTLHAVVRQRERERERFPGREVHCGTMKVSLWN